LTNGLSTELVDRAAADLTLTNGLSSELVARASADLVLTNGLSSELVARASADLVLTNDLSSELVARASADLVLTNDLSSELVARASADTAEASTRLSADTALDGRVSTLESVILEDNEMFVQVFTGIAAPSANYAFTLTGSKVVQDNNKALVSVFINGVQAPVASVSGGTVTITGYAEYALEPTDVVEIYFQEA
jgi:hypothetical protein